MSATSVAAFLRRDLLLLRRNTASLISMFVVPPLFLLCLYAVFGYSAGQSGFGYLRFVLGGCLFQAAMFTAAASAMAVGQDVESGLVDRVRVLPGATGGYVAGRLATDVLRMSASIARSASSVPSSNAGHSSTGRPRAGSSMATSRSLGPQGTPAK